MFLQFFTRANGSNRCLDSGKIFKWNIVISNIVVINQRHQKNSNQKSLSFFVKGFTINLVYVGFVSFYVELLNLASLVVLKF